MGAAFGQGRHGAWLAAILVLSISTAAGAQQREGGKPVYLRGQITAFAEGMMTVKTVEGRTVSVVVPKKARVSSLTKVDFSSLKKGDFIASAGRVQKDGTLAAIDVRIFPATGRHPPEYHRKYRLGPDSTMTNATVEAIVGDVSGRTFKVKYKGGEKTITVPPDALVMRQDPAKQSLLKPGANVSVVGTLDAGGKVTATRMAVGMTGLMPPT